MTSYYGRPILKQPTWTWEIPTYFFAGGMAGAASAFAAAAELRGDRALARRAWVVALAGVGASPPLLISDLGRPERFHHMLRVFKPTSPMNVGSWILSGAGTAIALGAARSVLGWFPRLGRVSGAAAVLGPALSTYTGVLVADTAIPVWHEARRELPWVFAAGSAMSAGAAVALIGGGAPARRLALAGAAGELAATNAMERRLGELGEPYREGEAGRFARSAKLTIAVGGGLVAVAHAMRSGRAQSGRRAAAPHALTAAGALLLLAGAFATRWSIYKAGFQSAANPRYVVEPQRARVEAQNVSATA
jgi:hypothetical protein